MKTWNQRVLGVLIFLSTLSLPPSITFAQGSLTPPGAPAPTMVTLSQIEPRTPISSAPFTISQPGSYYLTTTLNVTSGDAIDITTNDVTLDLHGFTISSTAPSATGTGILLSGTLTNMNIAICNGFIRGGVTEDGSGVYSGSGFGDGINYTNFGNYPPVNVRVSNVSISGCLYTGISLGFESSTIVSSCTVNCVGSYGISADVVADSTAIFCGQGAISARTASNCYGVTYNNAAISVFSAQNCWGDSYNGDGVYAFTANNCFGTSGYGTGIDANYCANNCYGTGGSYGLYSYQTAVGCGGYSGGGTGLSANVATSCEGQSEYGTGLSAYIANSCQGQTFYGTAQSITYKYNMP